MSGVHLLLMGMGTRPMPAFIDAGAGVAESPISGTLDVAYMATIAAGNILLMHIIAQGTASAITTPAGWTLIGTVTNGGAGILITSALFYKIATGGESGSVAVTATAPTRAGGRMYRFTSGTGVEAHTGASEEVSDTSVGCIDITTLGIRRLAIQCFWVQVAAQTIGSVTGETGTDYTEAVAEYSNGAGVLLSLQTGQVQNPTSITGGSATLSSAVTNKVSHGFAITP